MHAPPKNKKKTHTVWEMSGMRSLALNQGQAVATAGRGVVGSQ